MPASHSWFRGPKRLLWSFALILLLPAATVGWLGLRLIEQDRALESRRRIERRDAAADRVVAGLERAVSLSERQLLTPGAGIEIDEEADAVVVTFRTTAVEAAPRSHLLFTPTPPPDTPGSDSAFEQGESAEFGGALERAAALYRALTRSPEAPTRVGALVRLARTLRKMGRPEDALDTYEALSRATDARVAGLPADLVGRRARLALLAELGRDAPLRAGAIALHADLAAGRWALDKGTFTSYERQARDWSGGAALPAIADRVALSDVADILWWQWTRGGMTSPGRAVYPHQAGDITALWQPAADGAVVVLIAGPRFRSRTWLAPLGTPAGLDVTFVNPDLRHTRTASGADTPLLRRAAVDTGLPWTLVFADAPAASGSEDDGARRTVILAGLGLLMVVVVSGAVIVARGVAHELEVARLQSDFVSAVSHEFRTPLTSLQQFTELLNDAPEPPSEKRRLFYLAQARAVGRLQHLVETLLDFGRMEAGAYTYRMTRVAVETLVTAVVHTFRRDGAPTDFVVGCRIDPACGDVVADDEALGRALRNLLENAVKYSGDGRRIDVLAERVGDTVAISVRDEGLGVPHAEQSRIFTKFVRGASSRTYGINGSGIGLAMVREIVRAHDGDITVESDGRRGSTFTVRLPAAQAATDDCARDRVS